MNKFTRIGALSALFAAAALTTGCTKAFKSVEAQCPTPGSTTVITQKFSDVRVGGNVNNGGVVVFGKDGSTTTLPPSCIVNMKN